MSDLLEIGRRVASQAGPGEQLEVFVSRGTETEVRVYEGEIEHFVSAQSEGVGVRVVVGGRTGLAYAGSLEPRIVEEVLAEARDNARFGTPDEWAGIAEPDGVEVVPQELWSDALAAFPTESKIGLAKELERITLGLDGRIRVDDANYADGAGEAAIVTSTGIERHRRSNSGFVSVSTLADGDGETQTGWGFAVGRDPAAFDIAKAAGDAVDRATRLLGARKPASRRLTVVLDPYVTAQFLGVISSTLSGENVAKGRSFLANRLGDDVASAVFTLVDDPTDSRAYTATEVDGEGLAARRNVLIEAGVLQRFVHSTYSARRVGAAPTGNGVRGGIASAPGCGCLAMQLLPGTRSQDAMIAGIDDGLLVQSVQGLHSGVNPISGDFSTGATGLMIRNGQLAEPVKEFTIASTLQRMLRDVVEVGNDVDWLPMRAAGVTVMMDDITVSGS
jgi:PmbA protein